MTSRERQPGSVRIIGGEWRGRRLGVADVEGLRPSGDRCRETLFNWLQAQVSGAHAADLFAGTGVLGFEAVSRGAARATLVERSPVAAAALRRSAAALGADRVHIVEGDGLSWLASQPADSIDLVFVDPPFGTDLAAVTLAALAGSAALRRGALVYVESARGEAAQPPPPGWACLREQVLGEVRMQLLRVP